MSLHSPTVWARLLKLQGVVNSLHVYVFSHVWLCDPVDCSPPGSSVHRFLQARTLEWVAISFCRESSQSRDWIHIFCLSGRFFRTESSGKPYLTYTYSTNNREFTNKLIVKIKWFYICKVLIAVIIFGVVVKLLLSSSFSKTENVGHNSLSQELMIFIKILYIITKMNTLYLYVAIIS